ncbi:hypothetical protein FHR83_009230 [Actinoplanes campanulatus]|uniref:Uncharacterized protein n=1 Tax=Actinoplanes campanulatus TaxID=113559 RepID=A0A7W5FKA7_9ACTN|nr:hypothetical protein [Actinoplanes campanulatus]MBB3101501.1 hypothetical protein [Actinoplanes campanulatus]GGN50557.1 hypothetical protein GCM10010109_89810 [Actinoplanes campanulatus]
MQQPSDRIRLRLVRLVLMACTVLGLATMHTLGHRHTHDPGHVMAAIAGGGHHDESAPGPDPSVTWSVCLAVLTALGVLVLLLGRPPRLWTAGPDPRPGAAPARSAASRAPPRRPVGLRVASISVLRL